MSKPLLEFKNLSVRYGAIEAVKDLSFTVEKGQIVTLIGSNGAGKTSTLRAISGLVKPSSGEILFHSELLAKDSKAVSKDSMTGIIPLHTLAPHQIVRQRIAHSPEGRGIFLNLSVEENLDLGAWTAPDPKTLKDDLEYAFQLFPRLKERRKQNAGTLSGGEQQMLAMARALMCHPEVVLLDEPSLGLAPQIIEKIFEIIVEINQKGKTVLLVEQNALQALQVAHKGIVLETGSKKLEGPAHELLKSDEIRKAYLGE